MDQKTKVFSQTGAFAIWAILLLFIVTAMGLAAYQVRQNLVVVEIHNTRHTNEQSAWYGLEKFFTDAQSCSPYLRGKRLGDSVVSGRKFGPQVGREWLNSGWIVKDVYVLRREDEVAWQVNEPKEEREEASDHKTIYIKVSLIPEPRKGSAGVDYVLNATAVSRIFAVKVTMAEERVFGHCHQEEAEKACKRAAFEIGATPQMRLGRSVASVGDKCGSGVIHKTQCLLAGENFPVWRCN